MPNQRMASDLLARTLLCQTDNRIARGVIEAILTRLGELPFLPIARGNHPKLISLFEDVYVGLVGDLRIIGCSADVFPLGLG